MPSPFPAIFGVGPNGGPQPRDAGIISVVLGLLKTPIFQYHAVVGQTAPYYAFIVGGTDGSVVRPFFVVVTSQTDFVDFNPSILNAKGGLTLFGAIFEGKLFAAGVLTVKLALTPEEASAFDFLSREFGFTIGGKSDGSVIQVGTKQPNGVIFLDTSVTSFLPADVADVLFELVRQNNQQLLASGKVASSYYDLPSGTTVIVPDMSKVDP